GTAEKCEACKKLGADVAVNYKSEDFVAATKAATAGKGADVILDMVGGDYVERNYEAAAVEGRVVQIAFQGSYKATVDFRRIMLKRLTHTGSTLRARSVADKGTIARGVEEQVLPHLAAGRAKPVIDSTFPLAQAAAAHARMETSAHIGDSDRILVSTAPGPDGIVQRMDVRARECNTNWAVFALANSGEDQIDRLIVIPHYRLVGSGLIWPDLGLSRIVSITSSGERPDRQESATADVFRATLDPGAVMTY